MYVKKKREKSKKENGGTKINNNTRQVFFVSEMAESVVTQRVWPFFKKQYNDRDAKILSKIS